MSGVMAGRAGQLERALEIIEQAAGQSESAAIAVEELEDIDAAGLAAGAVLERLAAAIETIEDSAGALREQHERLREATS